MLTQSTSNIYTFSFPGKNEINKVYTDKSQKKKINSIFTMNTQCNINYSVTQLDNM